MATTYSLGITGYAAHNPLITTKTLQVPDADINSNVTNTSGGQQHAMRVGEVMLCKDLRGVQKNYRLDAERSDPSRGLLYFLPLS